MIAHRLQIKLRMMHCLRRIQNFPLTSWSSSTWTSQTNSKYLIPWIDSLWKAKALRETISKTILIQWRRFPEAASTLHSLRGNSRSSTKWLITSTSFAKRRCCRWSERPKKLASSIRSTSDKSVPLSHSSDPSATWPRGTCSSMANEDCTNSTFTCGTLKE